MRPPRAPARPRRPAPRRTTPPTATARIAESGARVPLNRALSKLGVLSRTQATQVIKAGRVSVDGRVERNPLRQVAPERTRIELDGKDCARSPWRVVLFHKPRGTVTTRTDPDGRKTVFDALEDAGGDARGLIAVGRLDLATSGLLLLTTDTQLANQLTDPANRKARVYLVTVRGEIAPPTLALLQRGVTAGRDVLIASRTILRKASTRESHLTIELREGRNREIRRMFEAVGHEVTRLKRVSFAGFEIGDLEPGEWRELTRAEVALCLREP